MQGKVGKPSIHFFEYLINDKDYTFVREMCIKWINKGNWPKLEIIQIGTLRINLVNKCLEGDQCIDIILSEFQVLTFFFINNLDGSQLGDFQVSKYFLINNSEGSKLELALRNKIVKNGWDD